jgi:3-mercaptopyruvate sulfurtransferase SseA
MSKRQPDRQLTSLPLIIGGVLVLALLGFAGFRMTHRPPAAAPVAEAPAVPAANDEEAAKAAIPRITVPELKDAIAKNAVTVIDVRDADSYLAGHIPGALQIPLTRIDGEVPYLAKEKPIVTYCT